MIERFVVSRDDGIYEAFPDVALTQQGKLVCVFAECTHHADRGYTRIMVTSSSDRGRTWSPKTPLTEATHGAAFYNCPRISALRDGRLVVVVDKIHTTARSQDPDTCHILLYTSEDGGESWTGPLATPARGIVPDRLVELSTGRWLLAAHYDDVELGNLVQRLWYSDDQGDHWSDPVVVGRQKGLNLCEVSILPVDDAALVAFHRENSGLGWDCYKTISHDDGASWSSPIPFPLPACHRPVAGWLQNGQVLITHRFMQGGKGWTGWWTQNLFAALTDRESVLATSRSGAHTRILPIDFDRSPESDTGYSGWVQLDDGSIYVVNYILDNAPKAQIRGYRLGLDDFILVPEDV
ncbi:MAG: exo-alpha-sialidase [Anaerolineae bacterium]|nr:exo-alpha-sialidase [Anaerolineae bacterium]